MVTYTHLTLLKLIPDVFVSGSWVLVPALWARSQRLRCDSLSTGEVLHIGPWPRAGSRLDRRLRYWSSLCPSPCVTAQRVLLDRAGKQSGFCSPAIETVQWAFWSPLSLMCHLWFFYSYTCSYDTVFHSDEVGAGVLASPRTCLPSWYLARRVR